MFLGALTSRADPASSMRFFDVPALRQKGIHPAVRSWFEPTIIVTCVRRYLRFSLTLRDVSALIAKRGLSVHHTSIRIVVYVRQ